MVLPNGNPMITYGDGCSTADDVRVQNFKFERWIVFSISTRGQKRHGSESTVILFVNERDDILGLKPININIGLYIGVLLVPEILWDKKCSRGYSAHLLEANVPMTVMHLVAGIVERTRIMGQSYNSVRNQFGDRGGRNFDINREDKEGSGQRGRLVTSDWKQP